VSIAAVILLLLKSSIVLSVFAIGLKATFTDATFLLRRPEQLGRALVLSTILAPLVAGIAVRRVWSAVAHRVTGPVAALGSAFLIASAVPIVIGLATTVLSLVTDGTILGLGSFALAGLFIGHVLGGPEPADRPVLALATASRHPAVAMAIAHTNFPDQRFAGAAVFL
jgi:BASS family bile acid:Na+ symporter